MIAAATLILLLIWLHQTLPRPPGPELLLA
jgi:hypothetical protein